MAEGTIRIVPESTGQSEKPIDSEAGGDFQYLSAEEFGRTDSNNGTKGPSARERRKQKRASLRVTDRSTESQEVSDSQPERKTPPPRSRRVTEVKHYLTDTEALTNAKFYLSALEMMAVSVSGASGEMTEFERAMMTPALKRTLARIPIEAMNKGNVVLDSILLVGGMTMYMNHAAGGFKWSWPFKRNQKKGVVNDTQAPVSQPMETVVQNVNTGDLDGLAVPVPEVFTRYMNGNI